MILFVSFKFNFINLLYVLYKIKRIFVNLLLLILKKQCYGFEKT